MATPGASFEPTFFGKVWPPFHESYAKTGTWPAFGIGGANLMQITTLGKGTEIKLRVSLFGAEKQLPMPVMAELRNRVREFAQWTLNVHGFASGEFRALEIHEAKHGKVTMQFSRSDLLAEMRAGKAAAEAAGNINLHLDEKSMMFLKALKSVQLAVLEADETPFLAYRAVECLRHAYYLPGEERRTHAAESWKRMWADLGISPARTRAIQSHAEEIRHGGDIGVPWEIRRLAIEAALEVLDAYAMKHVWPSQRQPNG